MTLTGWLAARSAAGAIVAIISTIRRRGHEILGVLAAPREVDLEGRSGGNVSAAQDVESSVWFGTQVFPSFRVQLDVRRSYQDQHLGERIEGPVLQLIAFGRVLHVVRDAEVGRSGLESRAGDITRAVGKGGSRLRHGHAAARSGRHRAQLRNV